jgi:hypothetical protein
MTWRPGANDLASDSLPDSDPVLLEDLATHVQAVLQESSRNSNSELTTVQVGDQDPQAGLPITPSMDISMLVEIRQRHQTKEAEKGVRLASRTKALEHHSSSGARENPISEHRLLAQKIRDLVKAVDGDEKNAGSSTGLNRRIRWTKTPGLYSSSTLSLASTQNESKSGNSANALEVAQKAANLVSSLVRNAAIYH